MIKFFRVAKSQKKALEDGPFTRFEPNGTGVNGRPPQPRYSRFSSEAARRSSSASQTQAFADLLAEDINRRNARKADDAVEPSNPSIEDPAHLYDQSQISVSVLHRALPKRFAGKKT